MATNKSMKCYKSISEGEAFCCHVATDPVGGDTEVRAAVVVRPYVRCKRNLADSKLVSKLL
jgi:hypothetical protein